MLKKVRRKNLSIKGLIILYFTILVITIAIVISCTFISNWNGTICDALKNITIDTTNRITSKLVYSDGIPTSGQLGASLLGKMKQQDYSEGKDIELHNNVELILERSVEEQEGYAFIVDKASGGLIATSFSEKSMRESKSINDLENTVFYYAYIKYLNSTKNNFIIRSDKGKLCFDFKEYNNGARKWVIVTAIPLNYLSTIIEESIKWIVIFVIFVVIVSLVVHYYMIKKLFRPLDNLKEVVEQFSRGDLDNRVRTVRDDEIGCLSDTFNQMANTISWLVNGLEDTVSDRTSELEVINSELVVRKNQLQLILDSTAEAIYGIDVNGKCTFCNRSCIELLGYESQEELLGMHMHRLIYGSNNDDIINDEYEKAKVYWENNQSYCKQDVFKKKNGTSFDVEFYSHPQFINGEIVGAVITFMDISERKKNLEKIRYLSNHDSLTGLINRGYFEETLKNYDKTEKLPLSLIFADVNGLKLANDIFGHSSGDLLIKECADVLKNSSRGEDIVARIGGDEFVMILPNTSSEDAKSIMNNIKNSITKININEITSSISLGYDTKVVESQNIKDTMENAENEMYKEKTLTRKSFTVETLTSIFESLHHKNPEIQIHSEGVSSLCEKMGIELGLSDNEVKKIKDAGYYHDIGKIIVCKDILEKEELTESEIRELQQHSVVGYRILNLFDETLDLANGVYSHHERWDGTGYPKGLKGEEIPLVSRIIAITEKYQKWVTDSKLSKSEDISEVLEKIRNESGKKFDPELTEIFIKMIQKNQVKEKKIS
ncbi:diguanylate cyclase [Anaeromicropila herbilytica]|uniref:Diguanylate cyclase n=1 Tax=Anaeromicropila herbilytica TaxID=2785025 RepID=A0A7R7IEQ6_9FIRM|nr:diguanylate cyclase [Anaeromicropila herbilytica]BCN32271.1 hypothetical protein bsdtb5_35660 [Anaeromicropila herbilytica]